jgi:hypothetical protein
MRLQNYSFSTGRYTALSMECCNSTTVQSASIIAQSVASGTSPDIIIAQRTSNTANSERLRIDSGGHISQGGGATPSSTNGNVGLKYGIKSTLNNIIIGETTNASMHGIIIESRVTGRSGGARCSQLEMGDGVIKLYTAPSGGAVAERLRIDSVGQVLPGADDAQNLGSSTKRWKNIYAADMHFSNKGKTNDVDGTWGDWTLQEGEDSIFMINNRTGKKYSITMKEIN